MEISRAYLFWPSESCLWGALVSGGPDAREKGTRNVKESQTVVIPELAVTAAIAGARSFARDGATIRWHPG